jgi:hypothetical protein
MGTRLNAKNISFPGLLYQQQPVPRLHSQQHPLLALQGGLQRLQAEQILRDCEQGQPGIAQCKLPASQVPLKERPIGLTSGENGEEIACEKVEVETQVRHRHNDARGCAWLDLTSCIGTPRCIRLSVR